MMVAETSLKYTRFKGVKWGHKESYQLKLKW